MCRQQGCKDMPLRRMCIVRGHVQGLALRHHLEQQTGVDQVRETSIAIDGMQLAAKEMHRTRSTSIPATPVAV